MDYRIVRYTPRFRSEIAELLCHLWSPDPALNKRAFAWKYERNPYRAEPLIFVALAGERVVGMRGAWGSRWTVGDAGTPLLAFTLADLVVHPEHRMRGLWLLINRALADEARRTAWSFLLDTSAGRVTAELSRRSGWRETVEIRPLVWSEAEAASLPAVEAGSSTRCGPVTTGLSRTEPDPGLEPFDRWAHCAASADPRISTSNAPRPVPMAALAARVPARGAIRHARDVAYFEWRFDNPLCHYRFVYCEAAEGGGAIDGYLVLHSHGPAHDTGINLVDWEAGSPDVLAALLAVLRAVLRTAEVTTWPCDGDPAVAAVFRRAGFQTAAPPPAPWILPRLLVQAVAEPVSAETWLVENIDLLGLDSWDLRMTASDFY